MRLVMLAALTLSAFRTADAGGSLDGAGGAGNWTTGYYEMRDIHLSSLPPTRADLSGWDPRHGPTGHMPDVFLDVFTMSTDEWDWQASSVYYENCGTDLWIEDLVIFIGGPDAGDVTETEWIYLWILDYDAEIDDSESIDASGSLPVGDFVVPGPNTILCENGAVITFDLVFLGREGSAPDRPKQTPHLVD